MSRLSPINQARWARFRRNRRGYWSLWIFLVLFTLSLAADLIANDKPLLVRYEGRLYLPFMINYSETAFGGELNTEADYQDPFVQQQIERHGWRFGRRSASATTPSTSPPRCPSLAAFAPQPARHRQQRRRRARSCSVRFSHLDAVRPGVDAVFQPDRRVRRRNPGYYGGRFDLWGNALSKCGRACRRCF